MLTRFTWIAVLFLITTLAPRAFALRSQGVLTAEEAKAAGLVLRATPAGPDAKWVRLEFDVTGKLQNYSPERSWCHVELEIREGNTSLLSYAVLQEKRPKPGRVQIQFMANRALLDKLVFVIVIGQGAMPGGAYEVPAKDFLVYAESD